MKGHEVIAAFTEMFSSLQSPTREAVYNFSAHQPNSGRPKFVRLERNIQTVVQAFVLSINELSRRVARELEMAHS
jgi:hypothetical protein